MRAEPIRNSLVLCMLLATVLSPAQARICMPPEAKPDSPYQFLLAVTDALTSAKLGRERFPQNQPGDADSVAIQNIMSVKLADIDYRCAVQALAPYLDSSDEKISKTAKHLSFVLDSLLKLDDEFLKLNKDLIDAKPANTSLSALAERIADFGAKSEQIWDLLPMSTIGATYVITDVDPASGKLERFKLSTDQRKAVLQKLREAFGPSVEKGMQPNQFPVEVAAGALYGFISDQRWKSSDAR